MFVQPRIGLAIVAMFLAVSPVFGQQGAATPMPPQPQKPVLPTPPPANQIAATVNGQPIFEIACYRAVMRETRGKYEDLRNEAINFLVDNSVVDQYVKRFNVEVTSKEIDQQVEELRKEAQEQKQDFDKLMEALRLTVPELRTQVEFALRWEKFVEKQTTDEALKGFFDKNVSMFDGTQVNARHILVSAESSKPEEAKMKVLKVRQEILEAVVKNMATLSANTDALTKEKERTKLLDKAFAEAAAKNSDCPSKLDGGNLGWFARTGAMVEPFARAAFALKPFELSDAVLTSFGYHLILSVEQKPGREVKFDDVKPIVAHFYGLRLREAILRQYKPQAQIVIQPLKK